MVSAPTDQPVTELKLNESFAKKSPNFDPEKYFFGEDYTIAGELSVNRNGKSNLVVDEKPSV